MLGSLVAVALAAGCALFFGQRRMIYFTSRYAPESLAALPRAIRPIEYVTSQGRQTIYYLPPQTPAGGPGPGRLWMTFNGNASLALNWLGLGIGSWDPEAAFLLFDYPGYGACEGRPTRATIRESARAALEALAAERPESWQTPTGPLCLLGHSLGGAAALDLAAAVPVERVVLVSPFSSMEAMARRGVGWPLSLLVRDRFDNGARLAELARREPRPAVAILHGSEDSIVPVRMGRDLAGRWEGWIRYVEIPGGDHNDIVYSAADRIAAAMRGG
jgi:hypothetical protein